MAFDKFRPTRLKPNSEVGSGRVKGIVLPGSGTRITQITTFCPDVIGPGPTHAYLIEDDAVILMDVGIPTFLAKVFFYDWRNQAMPPEVRLLPPDHAEKELLDGLRLAGYSPADIDLIVISHCHPDHFLNAGAILSRGNARIAAHVLDTPGICNPWGLLHMWLSRQDQMRATGMPPAYRSGHGVEEIIEAATDFQALNFSLKVDLPILSEGPLKLDGSRSDRVQALHIPGHSPGSVGLLVGTEGEDKVLLCGDVMLYPITPHPDDLLIYLRTLHRFKDCSDVGLALPAHGKAIHDLRSRVEFLLAHHKRRLRLTFEACRKPRCVWDIATMPNYFHTYVDPNKFNFLAGSEALVHVEMLAMVDGLNRSHIKDSVHYFVNSREPFEEVYGRVTEIVTDSSVNAMMRY